MERGGYEAFKESSKKRKPKKTREERLKSGRNAILAALGEQEALAVCNTYKFATSHEQDGVILSLLSLGHSQIQIRGLLGVGGYRMARLQKLEGNYQDGVVPETTHKSPKHSLNDQDKARVKHHISDTYDLEAGFACAHRSQMLYLPDETLQWKDIYDSYCESVPAGERIVSKNRWREYLRYFYPNLRLHRTESDLCNACYRIDTALKDPSVTPEAAEELRAQKDIHVGKLHHLVSKRFQQCI